MIPGFRRRIRQHEILLGPVIQTPSPQIVEIAALAGFDFVMIDTEHGEFTLESVPELIRAADARGVASVVKVRSIDESLICKALDFGANAVSIPGISTASEAELVAAAARYVPRGKRSGAPTIRAAAYSSEPWPEYLRRVNEEVSVWVKVEGEQALENIGEIIAAGDPDVISIGLFDLSQSLGVPGELNHPKVIEAVKKISNRVGTDGPAMGTFARKADQVNSCVSLGLTVFNYTLDQEMLLQAFRDAIRAVKAKAK